MTDNLNPSDRRRTMQAVKSKGTSLERRFFGMLASMGMKGWRKNADDLMGKPDAVFDFEKVAVFLDGCFWHGCPYCNRKLPQTNTNYWQEKIRRNIRFAKKTNRALRANGWHVIRLWEHEVLRFGSSKRLIELIKNVMAKKRFAHGQKRFNSKGI